MSDREPDYDKYLEWCEDEAMRDNDELPSDRGETEDEYMDRLAEMEDDR